MKKLKLKLSNFWNRINPNKRKVLIFTGLIVMFSVVGILWALWPLILMVILGILFITLLLIGLWNIADLINDIDI